MGSSGGAKNILTKKEIEECDGIIIAADKNVETARFGLTASGMKPRGFTP